MRRIDEVALDYTQFVQALVALNCTTQSALARPRRLEEVTTYQCTVADLIESPTYPVRFLRPDGSIAAAYATGLQPISLSDFAANDQFAASALAGWMWSSGNFDRSAPLAVLLCLGCNRDVVIDGTHRVVWFATRRLVKEMVSVIELARASWPPDTPDMQNVCACGCR